VCQAYYDCAYGFNNVGVTRVCSDTDEFNAVTKKCEPKETAGCSTPPPTTPKNFPKFDNPKCTCTCSAASPIVTNTIDVPEPPKTKCIPSGNAVDVTSCRHFLVCDDTGMTETRRRCATTLTFDEEKKTCLQDADCGNRPFV
jgi:hypothetical protein